MTLSGSDDTVWLSGSLRCDLVAHTNLAPEKSLMARQTFDTAHITNVHCCDGANHVLCLSLFMRIEVGHQCVQCHWTYSWFVCMHNYDCCVYRIEPLRNLIRYSLLHWSNYCAQIRVWDEVT